MEIKEEIIIGGGKSFFNLFPNYNIYRLKFAVPGVCGKIPIFQSKGNNSDIFRLSRSVLVGKRVSATDDHRRRQTDIIFKNKPWRIYLSHEICVNDDFPIFFPRARSRFGPLARSTISEQNGGLLVV